MQCQSRYIGQTCRSLSTGIKEHQTDLKNFNLDSATDKHATDKNHKIDYNNARPVDSSSQWYQHVKMESLYLESTDFTMNRKGESNVREEFLKLFKRFKKK